MTSQFAPVPRTKTLCAARMLLCVIASVVAVMILVGCASAARPPIVVNARREQLEYHTFPKGQPFPGIVRLRGESVAGACESAFEFQCTFTCSRPRLGLKGLTTEVTAITVTADLQVTIWTEEGSTPDVLEHEEVHRSIAEHYYAMTEEVALRLARPYLGRRLATPMTTDPNLTSTMADVWQHELFAALRRETRDRAATADDIFDTLTHGRPPDAIRPAHEAALKEEAAAYAAEHERL